MATTKTAATTTATTATASVNPSFPFMKLPTELRLQIYKIAVEDAITTFCLTFDFSEDRRIRPKYRSALALLHTSKEIRAESAEEMWRVAINEHYRRRMRRFAIETAEENDFYQERIFGKCPLPSQEEKTRDIKIELMVEDMEMMLQKCVKPSSADVIRWFVPESEWPF